MGIEAATEKHPEPIQLILDNRAALSKYGLENAPYTPPGAIDGHYVSMYYWDSCRSAEKLAQYGYIPEAITEIDAVLGSQNPATGFIPNMTRHVKRPAYKELEWLFFMGDRHSDYTQPPMVAQTAKAIYDAYERAGDEPAGYRFLEERYSKLKLTYDYFRLYRQASPTNPLIVKIHPNETGRDSCPIFDFSKLRLKRNGPETSWVVNTINPVLDYLSALNLNRKNMKVGWDIQAIRKHFDVVDVMFDCIYANNLLEMSKIAKILGKEEDMVNFQNLADDVEQAILEQTWDSHARGKQGEFFSLRKGRHIKETTASNLYPLLLPNLPLNQLNAILDIIESDFDTPYMLPTVSTKSPNFDPHRKEKGTMWRSEVWWWINSDNTEGLEMQADRDTMPSHVASRVRGIARHIGESSLKLFAISPHETHNPITGEGLRTKYFAGAASAWPNPHKSMATPNLLSA